MGAHCSAAACRLRRRRLVAHHQLPGAVSVGLPSGVTSRSAHIPLASLPPTSEAMRKLPVLVGVNSKLADWPGSSPCDGLGVDQLRSRGVVSCRPLTTEQEFGTVPWFSHWTVTVQPTGMVRTSAPLP